MERIAAFVPFAASKRWVSRLSGPVRGATLGAAAVLGACLFCLFGLIFAAQRSLRSQMQIELRNVAAIAARFVDPSLHATFRDPSQEQDSLYLAALAPLAEILKADPSIKFIYTMINRADGIHFVLDPTPSGDSDSDGVDDKSHIGQPYPDASEACRRAFATAAPTIDRKPYTDSWGTFYSAYSPIFRPDGSLAAVLGVDMSAANLETNLRRLRRDADIGIIFSLLLSGAVFAGVFVSLRKRNRDALQARAMLADLERARVVADSANQAKSEFLSIMSHEIRTPLNGVIGCASMLEAQGLPPDQAPLVRTIQESGELLLRLVNDILDFSRFESKGVDLAEAPFDLQLEINWVANLLGPKAKEKGLELSVEYPETMARRYLGDSTRIRQILMNLAGNALKFTELGGIRIVAAPTRVPGGERPSVMVSVHDSGIGLRSEDSAKLFQPFTQAEASTSRRFGGTGLGLSICKRLVESMGGGIWVESEPGKGSIFRFTLGLKPDPAGDVKPIAVAPDEPKRAQAIGPGSAAELPRLNVLVVEDNQVNRMVIGKMLERLGCKVVFANDGALGAKAAEAERFDLILMDCQMPVMDGYESARLIQNGSGASSSALIVALTANAAPEEREKCLACGMRGFLGKPIRIEDLRATLRNAAAGLG